MMAKPLFTPKELTIFAFSRGFKPCAVDLTVSIIAPNVHNSLPFMGVKLISPAYLLYMLPDADKRFVYGEGGTFYFMACYKFFARCPFARIYSYALEDLFEIAKLDYRLRQYGYDMPTIAQEQFEAVIDIQGHAARVDAYRQNLEKEMNPFAALAEGRMDAKIVSKGFWFNTISCMACGEKGEVIMAASSKGFPTITGEEGVMMGVRFCTKCADDASTRSSFMGFIAEKLQFHDPFEFAGYTKKFSQEDIFELGRYTLEFELKCMSLSHY